jgi:hypothetical protein
MSETAKDAAAKPHNPNFCGKKGRSGPPRGNDNAARHYLRAGKLPPKLQYIEHRINAFRRHLEAAVAAAKGEVSIVDAAAINSACKWERHGLLAQHWLRHEAENLSASDRLRFSEAIAKASDNRDKNLRTLGLDAQTPAPWTIDAKPNGTTEPTT